MLPVEQPFKTYTGKDGKPLDNGFVYFGLPNQNPLDPSQRVTVYWDASGTIPANQPLRTDNGYIVSGGTPANVFFDGAYSELVLDSKQRQVFYARTSDEFSIATAVSKFIGGLKDQTGAAQIGFVQDGDGAVDITVEDELRERISVTQYGAKGNGTADDTAAFLAAIAYCKLVQRKLVIPAGRYKISQTLDFSGLHVEGAGYRLDPTLNGSVTNVYTQINSSANPIVRVIPYPGTVIENLTIVGSGTSAKIDLWEINNYTGQVGIFAGGASIMTTPSESYAMGGSGGLYMNRISFGGGLGWGLYCYKLWGQSSLKDLFFYDVGAAVGDDFDHYGAMAFVSECADTNIDNVHILSGSIVGTAIKIGAKKTETDALSRFYVGPSHLRFKNVFTDGLTAHYGLRMYTGINVVFTNCHWGEHPADGPGGVSCEFGEYPFVSGANCRARLVGCSYSYPKTINVKAYAGIEFSNCLAENETVIDYWLPFVFNGDKGNFGFYPSGDKAALSWSESAYSNIPVANCSNIDRFNIDHSLPYDAAGTTWSKTTSGSGFATFGTADIYTVGVPGVGTVEIRSDISGLVPGEIYSISFFALVPSSIYGTQVIYYAADGSAPNADIIRNKLGSSDLITSKYCSRVIQVQCPASGKIRLGWLVPYTESMNSVVLYRPRLYRGFFANFSERYDAGTTGARAYGEIKTYANEPQ